MWLWAQQDPPIHTLVVGAARPSDFDEHVEAARRFVAYGEGLKKGGNAGSGDLVKEVEGRLMAAYDAVWAADGWKDDWWVGLPDCYQVRASCGVRRWVGCCVGGDQPSCAVGRVSKLTD